MKKAMKECARWKAEGEEETEREGRLQTPLRFYGNLERSRNKGGGLRRSDDFKKRRERGLEPALMTWGPKAFSGIRRGVWLSEGGPYLRDLQANAAREEGQRGSDVSKNALTQERLIAYDRINGTREGGTIYSFK